MSVYIMVARELGVAKVGFTRSPARRLEEFQTCCPADLKLAALIPADMSCEKQIHDHLSESRKRGEWFYITPYIEELIEKFSCGADYKQLKPKAKNLAPALRVERRNGKYRARVKIEGARRPFGIFDTEEKARAAFAEAYPHTVSQVSHAAPITGKSA